jgi:hypothetical protein
MISPFSPFPLLPNHIPNQVKLSISPLSFHMHPMTVKNGVGNTLHDASNLGPKFVKKASSVSFSTPTVFTPSCGRWSIRNDLSFVMSSKTV